jgi:hypothetical protein
MVLILNGPIWFRGLDTLFTLGFALVTLFLALMSYRAYKVTELPRHKYFSLSFLLMSLGFGIFGIFSGLLVTHSSFVLDKVLSAFDFAFTLHVVLLVLAYILMTIVAFKVEDKKVISLLIVLGLLLSAFSYQHFLKFHVISFVLLGFLTYQFYLNFQEKKDNYNAKLVFTGFYLLTAAEIFVIVFIYTASFYIVAQVIQLLGYLLLLFMLTRILHYGREKRKA